MVELASKLQVQEYFVSFGDELSIQKEFGKWQKYSMFIPDMSISNGQVSTYSNIS
jgi:hypothetical protein